MPCSIFSIGISSSPFFSIGIVYYSGEKDMQAALSSLAQQCYSDFEIIIRDQSKNASANQIIQKWSREHPHIKIRYFAGENIFHSGGHNYLVQKMKGTHYICASVDMKYSSNMLQLFAKQIAVQKEASIFTGKMLTYNGKKIDSAGIEKTWYFRFYEKGYGKNPEEISISSFVFGVSGALFCIDKKTIEELQKKCGYLFNPSLHYKNDADLSCRLHIVEQKIWCDSSVYAFHKRQVSKDSHKSSFALRSSVYGQYCLIKKYSFSKLLPWYQVPFAWIFLLFSSARLLFAKD